MLSIWERALFAWCQVSKSPIRNSKSWFNETFLWYLLLLFIWRLRKWVEFFDNFFCKIGHGVADSKRTEVAKLSCVKTNNKINCSTRWDRITEEKDQAQFFFTRNVVEEHTTKNEKQRFWFLLFLTPRHIYISPLFRNTRTCSQNAHHPKWISLL